jgi:endonuclease YncB( thermonuclease family)
MTIGCAYGFTATVTGIGDSDVLIVTTQEEKTTVRLYGIDAPESGQQGSNASRRYLKRLVAEHPVSVEKLYTDGFGRSVAIVKRLEKESSINAAMVANGYAWVDPNSCKIDACKQWKRIEGQAKKFRLGIWSGYDLIPPWEFKQQQRRQ